MKRSYHTYLSLVLLVIAHAAYAAPPITITCPPTASLAAQSTLRGVPSGWNNWAGPIWTTATVSLQGSAVGPVGGVTPMGLNCSYRDGSGGTIPIVGAMVYPAPAGMTCVRGKASHSMYCK